MKLNLEVNIIPLFVYGTLMQKQRFSFYLEGTRFIGKFYTKGQLMKAPNDSVYIEKKDEKAITYGELYLVNYFCLQRINHLEALSGEFPVGYELALSRIWLLNINNKITFEQGKEIYAFYYRRKNRPVKILTGNYNDNFDTMEEIKNFLITNKQPKTEDIIKYMLIKMSILDYE